MDPDTPTTSDPEDNFILSSTERIDAITDTEGSMELAQAMASVEVLDSILFKVFSRIEQPLPPGFLMEKVVEHQNHGSQRMEEVRHVERTEKTFASIGSDAFELLSTKLAAQRGTCLAILKKIWDHLTAFITNCMATLRSTTGFFIGKLQTIRTILSAHWQASRSVPSIMAAEYPWLGSIMALCYLCALAAWVAAFANEVHWFYATRPRSRMSLEVAIRCLLLAIPYAMGRGSLFATFVLISVWVSLDFARS